jgi:HSP20 family protein
MALTRYTRRPTRLAFPAFGAAGAFPTFDEADNRLSQFIERMLREPFDGGTVAESLGWMPAMDIVETANELTVTAELPGLDQKDIDVSVEGGVLTIRGEKAEEHTEEGDEKKVYLYERSFGSFQRAFGLPSNIDGANVTATFDKGILKVHLPKLAETKPKGRKIEIKPA